MSKYLENVYWLREVRASALAVNDHVQKQIVELAEEYNDRKRWIAELDDRIAKLDRENSNNG